MMCAVRRLWRFVIKFQVELYSSNYLTLKSFLCLGLGPLAVPNMDLV